MTASSHHLCLFNVPPPLRALLWPSSTSLHLSQDLIFGSIREVYISRKPPLDHAKRYHQNRALACTYTSSDNQHIRAGMPAMLKKFNCFSVYIIFTINRTHCVLKHIKIKWCSRCQTLSNHQTLFADWCNRKWASETDMILSGVVQMVYTQGCSNITQSLRWASHILNPMRKQQASAKGMSHSTESEDRNIWDICKCRLLENWGAVGGGGGWSDARSLWLSLNFS